MINTDQIINFLKNLQQKNNQGVNPPTTSPIPQGQIAETQIPPPAKNSISALGFLGGLGDTRNEQGGVDPSWLTQANQWVGSQAGQGDGYQPLPWQQQPISQQLGQDTGSSIMKLLSSFL